MHKASILEKLATSKQLLKEQFSISRIGLFGSYARNSQHPDSDIDIVYELTEGRRLGLKEIADLEVFFMNLFQTEKIDLINQRFLNPIIAHEMKKSVVYV